MKGKTRMPRAERQVRVDWAKIHERLDSVLAASANASIADPEKKKSILKARAVRLAEAPSRVSAPGETLEIVEFLLAQETYGIESTYVGEVCPLRQLTPLPCTPAFVLGILNLRGSILSVIDIRKFFDMPAPGLSDLNKVIVLRSGAMQFGILADLVVGTRTITRGELQASIPTLTGAREKYLKGVTTDRSIVLDAASLLRDPGIVVNEQVNA